MEEKHETLGYEVVPNKYTLMVEPNLNDFTYACEEVIEVKVKNERRSIVLNAVAFKINKVLIKNKGLEQTPKVRMDNAKEILILDLEKPISGNAEIHINFSGENNDKLYGFYRSRYLLEGKEHHLLTTQFEAANARNAFPCFDEPAFKATFDLSLLVDKFLQCVSNMPIKEERVVRNKKLVVFHSTPKMSTYLLYIGIGEFERVTDKLGDLEIGVVTTPGKKQYTKLALENAKKILAFYQKYFGIRYPLPKIDLIAVPDFSAGAMENWGAVTFREVALLGDEKSAVMIKQKIAHIIAHEFAHQWFGDLVTMKWWDDLWLSESFATFMDYKAIDAVYPKWNTRTQFVRDVVGVALGADQLASTHPISVSVSKPGDIDQIFDEVSYEKGCAVLSMLEEYAGKETFRKGLHNYLNKHAYSNATKNDLWKAVEQTAREEGERTDISAVAKCWIDKPGYPAITVKHARPGFSLIQNRFVLSKPNARGTTWLIPVTYVLSTGRSKDLKFLMKRRSRDLKTSSNWIKLNHRQTGMYRTIYPEDVLDSLGELIKEAEMEWVDAWGVENDLYTLARGSRLKLEDYLHFVSEYCFAAKYPLNLSVLSHIGALFGMLYGRESETTETLRSLLSGYSSEIIKQIGWVKTEDESNITTMTRSVAVMSSGISGDRATIKRAAKLFSRSMQDTAAVDADLRGTVYMLSAWAGDESKFKTITDRYKNEKLPDEKNRLLSAIGMFQGETLLSRSLGFSLSKYVRLQDSYMVPSVVSSNPIGRRLIWGWTKKNWNDLMLRYGSGTHMLSRYVNNMRTASDVKTLKEIKSFFNKKANTRDDITKALSQTIEMVKLNASFIDYNKLS